MIRRSMKREGSPPKSELPRKRSRKSSPPQSTKKRSRCTSPHSTKSRSHCTSPSLSKDHKKRSSRHYSPPSPERSYTPPLPRTPAVKKLRRPSPIPVQRQVSPIRTPVEQCQSGTSSQVVQRKAVKRKAPKVKGKKKFNNAKQIAKPEGKTHVLRLDGISNKMLLSRLVHEFMVEFTSIIGVHRVADYMVDVRGQIVFMYLTKESEFKDLLNRRKIVVDGYVITITDPKLISARTNFVGDYRTASVYELRMTPPTIGLFGFRQLPTTTTFYVVAVLRVLEHRYPVTGFKLAYCEFRQMTRNFGFATFLTRRDAFKLLGNRLTIHGDDVEVQIPKGMPILISEDRRHLLTKNRCDLTDEIRLANWLNVNLTDPFLPMHPLPFGEIFQPTTDIQPPLPPPETHYVSASADEVIRHDTPPASPVLSIGADYELDDEGILQVPSTFWLEADGQ